ncbi:MAG: hydroxyisourate hydrolase [Sulfuriferula sp.]|nr:hydroxyisourate hydrolase [Sulfuriferula sp.]
MGKLSTHILDVARGCPAAGIPIALYRVGIADTPLLVCLSNDDGRTNEALLAGDALVAGEYELVFHVAAYFRKAGLLTVEPPFLDRIAIRFNIGDPEQNYHVPLLVSPWSYSTYRGS